MTSPVPEVGKLSADPRPLAPRQLRVVTDVLRRLQLRPARVDRVDRVGEMLTIKEILDRAVSEPDAVATALHAEPGVAVLRRSVDLTVVSVLIPAGLAPIAAARYRMWALVGIYGGQEDNQFFRRADSGLAESGGRDAILHRKVRVLTGRALGFTQYEPKPAGRRPDAHTWS